MIKALVFMYMICFMEYFSTNNSKFHNSSPPPLTPPTRGGEYSCSLVFLTLDGGGLGGGELLPNFKYQNAKLLTMFKFRILINFALSFFIFAFIVKYPPQKKD